MAERSTRGLPPSHRYHCNPRAILVGGLVLGTLRAPTHRAEHLALALQLAAEKNKRGKAFKSQIDFVCANVVSTCSAPHAEAQ